jgi:hypothetical protein
MVRKVLRKPSPQNTEELRGSTEGVQIRTPLNGERALADQNFQ